VSIRVLRRLRRRLRLLLRREEVERELDEEMRLHLERQTESNLARGMEPGQARRAALLAFGGVARTKLECRDARGMSGTEQLLQDLRFAVRMLVKSPGFTLTAIITLALGIGANSAIFSVVEAVLIRPLPYRDADRVVAVWERSPRDPQNSINLANFFDWRERNRVFEGIAAFVDVRTNIVGDGEPEELAAQRATGNLFSVLGVEAAVGRTFTPADAVEGQDKVVVIGHRLWQRRYGGDARAIGGEVLLGGEEHRIIGVLPPEFEWHIQNHSGTGQPAELWMPMVVPVELMRRRRGRFAAAVARLKPGVTLAEARAEMDVIGRQLVQEHPQLNTGFGVNLVPLREQLAGEIGRALVVLMGAVGLVLLIACANVANLLLARAPARRREIVMRAALGASRGRVVRQLLTESLLLAAIGGGAGLLLASWGMQVLAALSPPELRDLARVELSAPVFGFTLVAALLTGLVFGLVPAALTSSVDLGEALRDASRSVAGHRRGRRLRSALVVGQIGLALVLLVGAGLLARSFQRLQAVRLGVRTERILTMRVALPARPYEEEAQIVAFFARAIQRMAELPGVEAAGASNWTPFAGPTSVTRFHVEGRPASVPGQEPLTGVAISDGDFFRTLEIPLLKGRLFSREEVTERRHVVVVNQALARRYFPNEEPLGKHIAISMGDPSRRPSEIIGVVGDAVQGRPDRGSEPMSYWPIAELAFPVMTFVLRTSGEPTAVASAAREVIRALDPRQPIADVHTLETLQNRSIARQRFSALLLAVFAGMALLLAAVGIYGVTTYSVVESTRDLGVRTALGASRASILRLVMTRGMRLILLGIGAGVIASLCLTRLAASQLYEISATDPTTFASIAILLAVVALIACYLPARRAARIEPLTALRRD